MNGELLLGGAVSGALVGLLCGPRIFRATARLEVGASSLQRGLLVCRLALPLAIVMLFRAYRVHAAVWILVVVGLAVGVLAYYRRSADESTQGAVATLLPLVVVAEIVVATAGLHSREPSDLAWAAWLSGDRVLGVLLAHVEQIDAARVPSSVQQAALRALGRTTDASAKQPLARLIVAKSVVTRLAAAEACGDRGDSSWAPAWLAKLQRSPHAEEQRHAVEMLGALRARSATAAVANRLRNEQSSLMMRRSCAAALGRIRDPAGYRVLRRASLKGPWAVVKTALWARCQFGPLAVIGVLGDVLWFVVKVVLCVGFGLVVVLKLLGG